MSYLQTALKVIKHNDTQKPEHKIRLIEKQTREAPSLEDTLDKIISETMDRIIKRHKGRQYQSNAEIRQAENEIDRIYRAVLEGQASLSEFQDAVNTWERRTI